ncbi:MAG: hypothetical protein IPL78_25630 [Chloroflexi bacterium]|nr:hypothetical protein [Chloroflexota bacterium]
MTATTQPTVSSAEPQPEKLVPTLYVVLGVIGLVVVVGLLIALVLWLANNYAPQLEAIRDIFIVMLAFSSCGVLLVGILAVIMLIRLVNMLEFEIKPILEKTNETISTVQGTTRFVSQNVVKPTITISGYAAAVSSGLRTLLGNPKRNLPD